MRYLDPPCSKNPGCVLSTSPCPTAFPRVRPPVCAAEEEAALAPETNALAPENLPPQLLFVHGGQTDMKEMHWHPQVGGQAHSGAGGWVGDACVWGMKA